MNRVSLKVLVIPLIKSIDAFNYLLKSHHRRTAVATYFIGMQMGLSREEMVDLVIAASIHDIGALSVQERDQLMKIDMDDPEPHCLMGVKMLSAFDAFDRISRIIRHHHTQYAESLEGAEKIMIQSHIIHLADRLEILLDPNQFILNQKSELVEGILSKRGTIFHPRVCDAFYQASRADIFWIEISNMSMEQLFTRIDFDLYYNLTMGQMVQFSLVISRIIDFRSSFTAAHSYTVGQLAHRIGEILGYDGESCIKLMIAGYFHDIGKIGIDTGFIEKPGSLTEDEYNQVKLHSYYTGQILSELSQSEWFRDIVFWAKHHHEKAQGNGYPFLLKAEEITPEIRIIAYADIISALMERRPYRKGVDVDAAFDLIESELADDLDPELFSILYQHRHALSEVVQCCQVESNEIFLNATSKGIPAV